MDAYADDDGRTNARAEVTPAFGARRRTAIHNLNLVNIDPEIDLDVVAGSPRSGDYKYAVNALGRY